MNFRNTAFVIFTILFAQATFATDQAYIDGLIAEKRIPIEEIKKLGPDVMPLLINSYKNATDDLTKSKVAWVFYRLSWRSEEAKEIMLEDIHTTDSALRLQVQWALGRVSDDPVVVESLVHNMTNDSNPLFRDKAACALASDQIFQSPEQRYTMLEKIIDSLADEKAQVRHIANLALEINTGQIKGYQYNLELEERQKAIERWRAWLEEYRINL